jgi:hypothetical protein
MSELQHALELFGFLKLDDISGDSLKKAFKNNIIKLHPDRGGDSAVFDDLLHSYVYLSETVQRIHGGRNTLQNIVEPDQLKNMRSDELINRVFEEFDIENFNNEFEKNNTKIMHGYSEWLKNKEDESNLTNGIYGEATQKLPSFSQNDLNRVFEEEIKKDKSDPVSLILHPEAMAYMLKGTIGTEIIESNTGIYTADIFTGCKPEYTDLYSAYTKDNTIFDKVTNFKEDNKSINTSLDNIIAERNSEIKPLTDIELYEIQEFEKRKLESSKNHLTKIKEYFEGNSKNTIDNTITSEPSTTDNIYGFVHTF